jgi:hypoxanthine phosphoribosyltransferase
MKKISLEKVKKAIDDFVAGNPDFLAKIDFVVGVSRGGLVPAALLAAKIDKPLAAAYINKQDEIFFDRAGWINGKNVLVVDDIIRSGRTLWLLKNYLEKNTKPAAISFFALYKVASLKNDNYNFPAFAQEITEDVIFPWD